MHNLKLDINVIFDCDEHRDALDEAFDPAKGSEGTALSGSISTVLTVLSWICVGIHRCGVLPSPVCA